MLWLEKPVAAMWRVCSWLRCACAAWSVWLAMSVGRVSAFDERGLRPGVGRWAEPPVWSVKLKPETKADTSTLSSILDGMSTTTRSPFPSRPPMPPRGGLLRLAANALSRAHRLMGEYVCVSKDGWAKPKALSPERTN